jgi:hypothetical protein
MYCLYHDEGLGFDYDGGLACAACSSEECSSSPRYSREAEKKYLERLDAVRARQEAEYKAKRGLNDAE